MDTGVTQPTDHSSTSSSLIRLAQQHDPVAWDRLADLYGPLIYSWCRRYGLSRPNAADTVQETLTALLRSICQFDESAGSFRGWLWTIARNKMRDLARGQGRQPTAAGGSDFQQQLQQLPEQHPQDDSQEQLAWRSLLDRALAQVRVDFELGTWQAFWRVTVDGLMPAEAAVELGMSPAAVRQARSRVLRRLRDTIGNAGL